jgi:hypothetical protein
MVADFPITRLHNYPINRSFAALRTTLGAGKFGDCRIFRFPDYPITQLPDQQVPDTFHALRQGKEAE